jgi:tRNA(Ile)-lysidine synthase TilS/MesJ
MNCFKGHPDYLPIPVKTEFENFTIIRPFILTMKESMKNYIVENDLNRWVVEDETNKDESYRRNWIRQTLLPQINENGYNLYTTVKKRYGTINI